MRDIPFIKEGKMDIHGIYQREMVQTGEYPFFEEAEIPEVDQSAHDYEQRRIEESRNREESTSEKGRFVDERV